MSERAVTHRDGYNPRALLLALALIVARSVWCVPAWCALTASGSAAEYKDKNGYFTFTPVPGWTLEELSSEFRSKVEFRSPDNTVMIMVLAETNNDDLGEVYELKSDFIKEHKTLYPQAHFDLKAGTFAGVDLVDLFSEYPGGIKQEAHYLYYSGVRFDLTYTASKAEDFAAYQALARESLSTIKLKGIPVQQK